MEPEVEVVEEAWVDTAEFAMAASGKTPIRHRGAWIKEVIIDVVPKEPEETLGGRVPLLVKEEQMAQLVPHQYSLEHWTILTKTITQEFFSES